MQVSWSHGFCFPLIVPFVIAGLLSFTAEEASAQVSYSVEVTAGIAPVAESEQPAVDVPLDRVLLATVATDDSVVFATINPMRIWRLRDGVVRLVAGGGKNGIDLGFPAAEADLGEDVVSLAADQDHVYFVLWGGALLSVGPAGVIEYGGLRYANGVAMGPDRTMYAMQYTVDPGLYRKAPGEDWAMVPNTSDLKSHDGMAVDSDGDAILAIPAGPGQEPGLLKVTAGGMRTMLVEASSRIYRGDGGPLPGASAIHPRSPVVDTSGNIYFADRSRTGFPADGRIRQITPEGTIDHLPGCGLCLPGGVDSQGTLWVTVDVGISREEPEGLYRYSLDGSVARALGASASDGTAKGTRMTPHDIAFDGSGNLWVAARDRLIKIDTAGHATVVPGMLEGSVDANGLPEPTSSHWAMTVTAEPSGNILVAGVFPPAADDSTHTQSAIWRYFPEQNSFEAVLVPAARTDLPNHNVASQDAAFILDLAAPADGSIYFIDGTQSDMASTLKVVRPDKSVETLDVPTDPLWVDEAGALWVGQFRLDGTQLGVSRGLGLLPGQWVDQAVAGIDVIGLFGFRWDADAWSVGDFNSRLARNFANFRYHNGDFGGSGGGIQSAMLGPSAVTASPDHKFFLADQANGVIWKLEQQPVGQALFASDAVVNSASLRPNLAAGAWTTIFGQTSRRRQTREWL